MRVLDLFAGLRGWSDPWKERGHETFAVDIDERFDVDLHADVMELRPADLPWKPDVILASPPCETFSTLTMGRHWNYDRTPKTAKAIIAVELVNKTLSLVAKIQPRFWVMENPRAMLRKLLPGPLDGLERVTVTYCQYGEPFRKPTDLWGDFPPSWRPRPMCLNGQSCHIKAVRGSRTGIQGDGVLRSYLWHHWYHRVEAYGTSNKRDLAALRAKVPAALSLELCLAAESSEVLV